MPWKPKDAKRHTKRAKSPKAQRQWKSVANSVLERGGDEASAIRQANGVIAQHYADGGYVSPLASLASHAYTPHFGGAMPTAKMRMPRVPIADTMRNVDQRIFHAKQAMPGLRAKLGGKVRKYDDGGRVGLSARAIATLKDALSHLDNKDASSAVASLRSSPELMQHPDVGAAMRGLRASTGIAPATKTLTGLVNADTDRTIMPTVTGSYARGGRR
jgi:hypothetical protein